ncbi:DUF1533 domain-containing protein [Brevibacillus fluminis]|uniref:DUF1533 domain-containing protein n=1 Tax=Brevibacillus fluminis TaxID=511487 RepID=A0A3M8DWW5_9BACL|nr:DUF1533 domain-containing protein [Brevibacillus fluminis]RNB92673.1 DUF1533 domain-containing protein [Brevibacillus fluminis]
MGIALTADSTANNVDNPLEITFVDNANWETNVTAVSVDGIALATGKYSLSSGKLTIKQGVIQNAGDHTISVTATGYQPSVVTQTVTAGEAILANSSAVALSDTNSDDEFFTEVTLTAKDQYGNPVSGYQFKYALTVVQGEDPADTYKVDGLDVTENKGVTELQQLTDADGQVKLLIIYADTMGNTDELTYKIYLNDGTTMIPVTNL